MADVIITSGFLAEVQTFVRRVVHIAGPARSDMPKAGYLIKNEDRVKGNEDERRRQENRSEAALENAWINGEVGGWRWRKRIAGHGVVEDEPVVQPSAVSKVCVEQLRGCPACPPTEDSNRLPDRIANQDIIDAIARDITGTRDGGR